MSKTKTKVFVAMSGGVDSSVTAAILKERGFEITGVYMKCFNVDGCSEQDAEDARRVAEQLSIPFYVFDFEEEYKKRVARYMIDGYKAGITPNPDVMCNKEIKFGLFLKKALSLGADYVATGHYVRLRNTKKYEYTKASRAKILYIRNNFVFRSLFQAQDTNKDQSYFLWTLTQKQLRHCLFPIGEYTKPKVRALAKKFGLITAEKKDSQGICFLGQVNLQDFLNHYIPEKRGRVLNLADQVIGRHRGAHFYTIGQRSGLNSGNWQRASRGVNAEPFYVVAKDVKRNTIIVAEGDDNPTLYRKEVNLMNVNFISATRFALRDLPVLVRVRYRQPLVKARLILLSANSYELADKKRNINLGIGKDGLWKLVFDKPVKYVAEGQSAVFYWPAGAYFKAGLPAVAGALEGSVKNLEMLGGGIISS